MGKIKSIVELIYNDKNLIPVIVQDNDTSEVLMMAWMDKYSVHQSIEKGRPMFWSRSRRCYWIKGETSGNIQELISLTADCDCDCLLAKVKQRGVACHTGSRSCFFNEIN